MIAINLYSHDCPKVGDLVVCKTTAINDMYVNFQLLEYEETGLVGTAMIKDMVRKKYISNIKSVSKLNAMEILEVIDLDAGRQHVGLSKRNVSEEDKKNVVSEYTKNQKGYSIVKRLMTKFNLDKSFMTHFVYPLLDNYGGSIHDVFQSAREDYSILEPNDLPLEIFNELVKLIGLHYQIKPVDVWSKFSLVYYGPEGISAIKSAIESGIQSHIDTCQIHYVCAPIYMIKSNTPTPELAVQAHRHICDSIKSAIEQYDYKYSFSYELNTSHTAHKDSSCTLNEGIKIDDDEITVSIDENQ